MHCTSILYFLFHCRSNRQLDFRIAELNASKSDMLSKVHRKGQKLIDIVIRIIQNFNNSESDVVN